MRCDAGSFNVRLASPVSHVVIDVTLPTVLLRTLTGNYSLAIADQVSVEESLPRLATLRVSPTHSRMVFGALTLH